MLHAIGELPDRSRDAFLLREVGGMRHAEVAEVLGTSPGTARQAVFEARVALQDDRAGRDASCHAIREEISARERRRASRTVRGHLRSCTSCRDWSDAQRERRKALGMAPHAGLPLAGAGGLWAWVAGLVGGGAATGGATVKIVASVAAVATLTPVGIGTLEREARRHDRAAAAATGAPRRRRSTRPAPQRRHPRQATRRRDHADTATAAPVPRAAVAARVADRTQRPSAPSRARSAPRRAAQDGELGAAIAAAPRPGRRPDWPPKEQRRVGTAAPRPDAREHGGRGRRAAGAPDSRPATSGTDDARTPAWVAEGVA